MRMSEEESLNAGRDPLSEGVDVVRVDSEAAACCPVEDNGFISEDTDGDVETMAEAADRAAAENLRDSGSGRPDRSPFC